MADVNLPPGLADVIAQYLAQGSSTAAASAPAAERTTADAVADAVAAADTLAQDALGNAVRFLAEAVSRLYDDAHTDAKGTGA